MQRGDLHAGRTGPGATRGRGANHALGGRRDLWRPQLAGALCVIGNAPTALFRLLELVESGAPRPAAIIATPPGFVGASESKAALAGGDHGVPYLTLLGRRGGSAVAAAAVNALAAPPETEAAP